MTLPKKKVEDIIKSLKIDITSSEILQAKIDKVIVNNKNKELKLILSAENIINDRNLEKLRKLFEEKFSKFSNISLNVKYKELSINEDGIIDKYLQNIIYQINKMIPSSCAWIHNINYKIVNNVINFILDSEIAIYTLEAKSMNKILEDKIKNEFGNDVYIKFEYEENNKNEEDYLKQKELEESKILTELIVNNNNSKSNNSSKPESGKSFEPSKNSFRSKSNSSSIIKKIQGDITKISEINMHSGFVIIEGEIFDVESKEIKGDRKLYTFSLTDYTNSITVKVFTNKKNEETLQETLKENIFVRLSGDVVYDNFSRQVVVMLKNIQTLKKETRKDIHPEKRVELHCHTKMSSMDGMTSFSAIAKRASDWGHKAIAITDHGIVQSFPEGMDAARNLGIKVLYGVEGYLVNDSKQIITNVSNEDIDCEYVVFDIETTGFSSRNDEIIEIGAVKVKDGNIVDRYSQLIKPSVNIPDKIVELTGINDNMVKDKPSIIEVLPDFLEFINGSVLVAHNASFDVSFIKENLYKIEETLDNPILDTLSLTRVLFPELRSHKLNLVAKHLGISLENHHRAVDDSEATAEILLKCIDKLKEEGIYKLEDINVFSSNNTNIKSEETFHIIIFAKNQNGLKNLYKIISESHLNYFYRRPRIPKSLLTKYREDLIIGSACEAGELYRSILKNKDYNEISDIVSFYDFLEIQPIENNAFLVQNKMVKDYDELKSINKKIVDLGEKHNKPVVATGDVHFLDPEDEVYRRILMSGQGFSDADNQAPLYLKTTDEMLLEFSYLGEEKAKEVVIYNTNLISDMIEEIIPIPDGTFAPVIEGADDELRRINYEKAISIYGDPLPELVKARLDRELNSIISNGYAVMYIIAQKLVTKSLSDGYLVGSRGSVGSSFVATMSDITEVNPLPPHYVCPECKNSEFITDGSIGSGADLKEKNCPKCGTMYKKDGHDIPFEVFLGFEGDKEPDIDLNFAGEYQAVAHQYTEELFGKGYVFRAGTIGTIAEKTAYGFVKKYFDERNKLVNPPEINRLVKGCTGIKRTSGQHPGGIMVVPSYKDIYDFTPIQYPADDVKSGVITTHFDYHSISGRILKLDILGHDVPSIIKMLEDLTGLNAQSISLDDKETMNIFVSTESLGITKEDINSEVGTLGIPEFGTKFVRQMLIDTKPTTFAELVRISGLSHGTDVWINNAQELVRDGVAKLSGVICTRDDIMLYLIYNGLDKKKSFKIMEKVRKGKGLSEDEENYMRENNIPEWYIESCKKIKYMFPKAHAVAYVMMSFRIAYFKVHYPEAFYATYFTSKAMDFDAELIVKGRSAVENKIKELEALGNDKTTKEKNLLTVLEVALEMYARGFKFEKVDLYKSDSDKFLIGDEGIIPPLKSLEGVGENAARNIVKEREQGVFLSVEDLVTRAKVTKTVIEALRVHGCLGNMPESNQLTLFNI
ncbi:DNA polymerase III PolC-type [Gottschalkia purinilytica]|uniref:DNA polymerase III PolC-type n=1 Tax=Gottschalkia purinilytica TaxID=1503 RepID=A0A0L0WBN7_GOTPU|nr:PolC-type DNA polymerase III [Gottschalkia purinilytica]KNF08857.1 DNA polymerase III PolC-type [Gottschalkia purinilytica]